MSDFELHPNAEQFTLPTEEEAGLCACSWPLPAFNEWERAGRTWSNYTCNCGRFFVDEDDHVMIYDKRDAE